MYTRGAGNHKEEASSLATLTPTHRTIMAGAGRRHRCRRTNPATAVMASARSWTAEPDGIIERCAENADYRRIDAGECGRCAPDPGQQGPERNTACRQ